jgi:hypothetical protein
MTTPVSEAKRERSWDSAPRFSSVLRVAAARVAEDTARLRGVTFRPAASREGKEAP